MTYVEKLQAWQEEQVANGLVDIKFFFGDGLLGPLAPKVTLEELAERAYRILTEEGEDISELDI